jgi:hypothetical protein
LYCTWIILGKVVRWNLFRFHVNLFNQKFIFLECATDTSVVQHLIGRWRRASRMINFTKLVVNSHMIKKRFRMIYRKILFLIKYFFLTYKTKEMMCIIIALPSILHYENHYLLSNKVMVETRNIGKKNPDWWESCNVIHMPICIFITSALRLLHGRS